MKPTSHLELVKIFERLINKKNNPNWKCYPIGAFCTTDEVKITAEAIKRFTGLKAHFDYLGEYIGTYEKNPNDKYFKGGDHLMKVRTNLSYDQMNGEESTLYESAREFPEWSGGGGPTPTHR